MKSFLVILWLPLKKEIPTTLSITKQKYLCGTEDETDAGHLLQGGWVSLIPILIPGPW